MRLGEDDGFIDGPADGTGLGAVDGLEDGAIVGESLGPSLGLELGPELGDEDGEDDGTVVGSIGTQYEQSSSLSLQTSSGISSLSSEQLLQHPSQLQEPSPIETFTFIQ